MKTALLFPGQAAQFVGMARDMVNNHAEARDFMSRVDEILGYDLSKIMFEGPEDLLKETVHTQPAVYVHSMMVYNLRKDKPEPAVVAGHSLGEISACVAAGVLSFKNGLRLVQHRANAMQVACDTNPGTMAAILGLEDEVVSDICEAIDGVVPANFNCPGQLVISGSKSGIDQAIEQCKEKGARRALEIPVGGAFHSPLMQPAMDQFEQAIGQMEMSNAKIPVIQNVDAKAHTDAKAIRANLIKQVTSPVLWTRSMQEMISQDIKNFVEVGGKGKILMGMLRKISREVDIELWREE